MRVHVFVVVLSVAIAAAAVGQEEPPFDVDDVQAEAESGAEAATEDETGADTAADENAAGAEAQWQAVEPEPLEVPSGVDAAARISNVASSAWRIHMAEGDGLYLSGADPSRMMLEVDRRYHFDLTTTDSELYPLEFRGSTGRVLFSQQQEAAAAQWPDADIDITDDGITFTLTEDLAEQISRFRAATYPQMTGFVAPIFPDEESGADTEGTGNEAAEEAASAE